MCFRVWRTAGREYETHLRNVRVLVGPVNFGVSHAVVMACLSLYIYRNKLQSHEHSCMYTPRVMGAYCAHIQSIHVQKNIEFYQEQETSSGSTALPCQVRKCRKFIYELQSTRRNFFWIYFCRRPTCFRRFLLPSSGARNCTYSFSYCQPILLLAATMDKMELVPSYWLTIPEVVVTVTCPWWWAEEPPETFRALIEINLINVVTCWL
jgi:hypothetical protein